MRSALTVMVLLISALLAGCAGGAPAKPGAPAELPTTPGPGMPAAPLTPASPAPTAPPAGPGTTTTPAGTATATGTATPAQSANPSQLAADLPRLTAASLTMLEPTPTGVRVLGQRPLAPGESEAPAEGFLVTFRLDPPPASPWYREVRVEGAPIDPLRPELLQTGVLELRVHPGPANSGLTITLPPTRDGPQQVYRLTRAPLPAAEVRVEQGGAWVTPDPARHYPAENLRVRFRFTAPVDRASVAAALARWPSPETPRHPAMDEVRLTWQSETSLLAEWAKAPPVILWSLSGAATPGGLFVRGSAPALQTGPPPALAAIDPATGSEAPLFNTAPHVFASLYATDPGKLLLHAWDLTSTPNPATRSFLYDVTTGAVTPHPSTPGGRLLLVEATGEVRQQFDSVPSGWLPGPLSPDGTRRLLFAVSSGKPDEAGILTGALELRTAAGELVRVLDPAVRARAERVDQDAAWSADGRSILYTSRVDAERLDLRLLDLETEGAEPKTLTTIPNYSRAATPMLQWRGSRAVAGHSVIDVASGTVTITIEDPLFARWLSPDGRYLLYSTQGGGHSGDWGPVALLDLQTGDRQRLGEGLPAGWTKEGQALVLRWEAYPWRHRPGGL